VDWAWRAALPAAGLGLGAALVAFQLLPFLDQLDVFDLEYRVQQPSFHIPPGMLATVFVPDAYGGIGGTPFRGWSNVIESMSFAGAAVAVLALATVIAAATRAPSRAAPGVRGFFTIAALATTTLVYFGGPLLAIAQRLPPFDRNFVGRARSVLGFFVAVLAALAFDELLARIDEQAQRGGSRRRRARVLAFSVWIAAAAGVTALFARAFDVAADAGQARELARSAALAACGVAVAAGALVGATRARSSRIRWVAAALPIVVAIEALAFVLPWWPRVNAEPYPTTATHAFLAGHLDGQRYASDGGTMLGSTNSYYELRSVTGHAYQEPAWAELVAAASPDRAQGPTQSFLDSSPSTVSSPILDRLSARYFVANPEEAIVGDVVQPPRADGDRALRAGAPIEARISLEPLRGVVLQLPAGFAPSSTRPALRVELLDAAGRPVGTGTRRLLTALPPGTLAVGVPGESGRGARIRITLDAPGDSVRLGTRAGRLAIGRILPTAGDGLRLVRAGETVVYERTRSLDRIRWAGRAVVEPSAPHRLRELAEGVPAATTVLSESGPAGSGAQGRVEVLEDTGDRLRIHVRAGGTGFVVVADALQHGWTARLDGDEVSLRAADHALVAVEVPRGSHDLVLAYEPPGRALGSAVSLGAALVLLGLGFTALRHARARPHRTHVPGGS
jgi:hypothetical protein